MTETKVWYKSKGVLGSITGIIAAIVPLTAIVFAGFGYDFSPEMQQAAIEFINSGITSIFTVVSAVASIVALWGRLKATKRIGKEQ